MLSSSTTSSAQGQVPLPVPVVDRHGIGGWPAGDAADGCAGQAADRQGEIIRVHTADGLGEGDGETHAGKIRGIVIDAHAAEHSRRNQVQPGAQSRR